MKTIGWKNVVELIGITAIVASLLFVGLELRQSRDIAVSEGQLMIQSNNLELQSQINEHISIWLKGNSGANLDEEESAIYLNLFRSRMSRSFTAFLRAGRLGTSPASDAALADLSFFLYQNPGALKAWRSLGRDDVTSGAGFAWRKAVEASLADLDRAAVK